MSASRPFKIGLTGSIGMGKSTTAQMFQEAGVPVWDADAAVRRLYGPNGAAVAPLAALRPGVIVNDQVDRSALKAWISSDSAALRQIEEVVHPLVAADRQAFLDKTDADVVLLDIPLLFETGGGGSMDTIVVVTAPPNVQKSRVLERGSMTEAAFESILAKQTPDSEKRARADYVIETTTLEAARQAVHACLQDISRRRSNA